MVISALRQKKKFEFQTFLNKKLKFSGFHGVVLVKTFPLMYADCSIKWFYNGSDIASPR